MITFIKQFQKYKDAKIQSCFFLEKNTIPPPSLILSIINNAEIKNGINGIFNLTNAPKLEVEIATENAKNIAKINENRASGLTNKFLMLERGFFINI